MNTGLLVLIIILISLTTFTAGMGTKILIDRHYEKEDELKKLKKEVEELKHVNPRDL